MTKIKICGLSRIEDIEYVNELLPDYAGFVFAKSKRQVALEKAEILIKKLNRDIKTVGVFVNEDILTVKNIADKLKLKVIQFHGSEDAEYLSNFNGFTVWKAVSIKAEENNLPSITEYQKEIDKTDKYDAEAVLLDSSVKGAKGGTGVNFDWDIIPKLNINKKLILAGGLSVVNVKEAVLKVQPYAVDISSGVETDGVKDFNKIKNFIERVRNI